VYLIVGVGVWFHTFQSGLHPTLAGVLVALTIPARNRISGNRFLDRFSRFVRKVESEENDLRLSRRFYREKELLELQDLEDKLRGVVPPLQRLEVRLEEFVSYFVLPIFALANAGIPLSGGLETVVQPLTLTILGAMVLGKTFGVFTFSWLTVKLGLAELPSRTRWPHILGAGLLGGIGFTMAIFISNLALPDGNLLNQAKLGILIASLIAGTSGYVLLRITLPDK
jgi:NhaA family Na+:H+ antiporter